MQDPQVLSYLAVRRALGILGLTLPAVLLIYARVLGGEMQPSISEFYHTEMGDYLVGSLVAIGLFLFAYLGYPPEEGQQLTDRRVATIAGLGAIGVALFSVVPPDPELCPAGARYAADAAPRGLVECPIQGIVAHWSAFAWVHFASAAIFFLALAVFCFRLFPRGDRTPDGEIDWTTPKNRLYFACGVGLLISIFFLGVYAVVGDATKAALRAYNWVFWWETVGVVAFAISWLAKGKIVEGVKNLMSGG